MISFNAKASADEAKKHEDFVDPHGRQGLHAQAGAAAVRVVPARAQEQLRAGRGCCNRSSTAGWRARTSRSATASASCAATRSRSRRRCKRAIDGRGIRDIERGEDIHIPKRDLGEPVFGHGQGGVREIGAPGQPGLRARRPHRAPQGRRRRRQRQGPGQRLGRGRGRLRLRAQQGRVHAGLLRGPGAAAPGAHPAGRGAGVEEPPRRLHQRRHAQQPARGALDARRDRPPHRASAPARGASCASSKSELRAAAGRRGRRRWTADARDRRLVEAQSSAARARSARIPYLDPIDLRYRNRVRVPVPTAKAVMFCLMDVSGSMDEGAQGAEQALLHPALPVPDPALREDRHRLHPPPHPGAGGRRGELLPRPRDRRHGGVAARWC